MATPPFLPDQTKPGASDLISLFPAVEQTFRDEIESWLLVDHNTIGEHTAITVNSGAGTSAIIAEDGIDVSSGSAETWNFENSGAGAMTLKVDSVAVPTISSTSTLTNKSLTGAVLTDADITGAIRQTGDATTKITFASAAMIHEAAGTQIMHINTDGMRLSGSGTRVVVTLNQDDMSSDRADALATQQSIKAYVDAIAMVIKTVKSTSSGTSKTFASVPAGANRITVSLNGVSLSGDDELLLRIGPTGGIETGSYASSASNPGGSDTSTVGFILNRAGASGVAYSGIVTLVRITGNTWISAGVVGDPANRVNSSSGTKSLAGELTQLQILTTGSNSFDAGQVNIFVE